MAQPVVQAVFTDLDQGLAVLQTHDPSDLSVREHCALMRLYGDAQERCSTLIRLQAAEIAQLQAQLWQQRARAIVRETALAWAREDHMALQAQWHALEREQPQWNHRGHPTEDDTALQSLSQRATELLICQTGCVTHDHHWRQDDHCQRTGKTCVLAQQPDAMQLLHPHPSARECGDTAVEMP